MEIPASQGGVVKELKVALGDKVKEGSLVLLLGSAGTAPAAATEPKPAPGPVVAASYAPGVVASPAGAGYSAAFRAADLGLKVVLVERYATLGGVCLNKGCLRRHKLQKSRPL